MWYRFFFFFNYICVEAEDKLQELILSFHRVCGPGIRSGHNVTFQALENVGVFIPFILSAS